jgi:hypothetical protein
MQNMNKKKTLEKKGVWEVDEGDLTARVSVATAATTNIKTKVMMISSKKDYTSLPKGTRVKTLAR